MCPAWLNMEAHPCLRLGNLSGSMRTGSCFRFPSLLEPATFPLPPPTLDPWGNPHPYIDTSVLCIQSLQHNRKHSWINRKHLNRQQTSPLPPTKIALTYRCMNSSGPEGQLFAVLRGTSHRHSSRSLERGPSPWVQRTVSPFPLSLPRRPSQVFIPSRYPQPRCGSVGAPSCGPQQPCNLKPGSRPPFPRPLLHLGIPSSRSCPAVCQSPVPVTPSWPPSER